MGQEAMELMGSHIGYRLYQQYTSKGKKEIKSHKYTVYYYSLTYNECFDKKCNISQQQQKYDPCNLRSQYIKYKVTMQLS